MKETTTSGLALSHKTMSAPPVHIPDGKGGAFKTELTVARSPEYTEKYLWWYADDPRPEYHNHPWPFESTILSGGYTEHRVWIEDGRLRRETRNYREGDVNQVNAGVYHVVVNVLPGTATHLICGKASEGNAWGYLDLETLEHNPAKKEEGFMEKMQAINPHLRE